MGPFLFDGRPPRGTALRGRPICWQYSRLYPIFFVGEVLVRCACVLVFVQHVVRAFFRIQSWVGLRTD